MTYETREQIARDADSAFNEKRGGNIHFWTAKDDEPEVIFWKETWSDGATHQHPIAYEAGRKDGIEHLANVVISGIDARELDAHGRIPASTVKAIIKRELEALKTEKQ